MQATEIWAGVGEAGDLAVLKVVGPWKCNKAPLGARDPSFPDAGLAQMGREGGLDPGKGALALGSRDKGGTVDTKMNTDE